MANKKYNENDFVLLTENTYADGALSTIFSPVKDSVKKYGDLLKDSAKLIGNDIGALIGLTFGRLKDLQEQEEFMREYGRTRKNLVDSVTSKSGELMDAWPDGKITSLMVAPAVFFGTEALSGMGKLKSKEFRAEIGNYGFDKVPILGLIFNDGDDVMSDNKFWRELKQTIDSDDWEGSGEQLNKKIEALMGKGKTDPSVTLFQKINKIFLWSHHSPAGGVLLEGDEEEDTSEIKEQFWKWFSKEIENQWPIDREKLLEVRNKEMSKLVDGAAKTISLNSMLASCKDHKEFFKVLKEMGDLLGEESKFDADKVEKEFVAMGKKFKDDKETMENLKKEFEENNKEATEESVTKRIVVIVLDQFKSQFLPKLREELIDYYDDVYDIISDKMEKKQMEPLADHKFGNVLVTQIKDHKKKLDDALSKLERE